MPKLHFLLIGLLPLLLPVVVQAQEMSKLELHALNQRMSETLSVVRSEFRRSDSPLELVDSQKADIEELLDSYKEFVQRFAELSDEDRHSAVGGGMIIVEVGSLSTKLTEDILLPHQTELLNAMVFARSIKKFGDNPVRAIITRHADEFEFDEQQLKKLREIQKETTGEIDAIRKKYEKEIEEVRSRAKSEIKKTLTKKQLGLLEKYNAIAEDLKKETESDQ